MESNARGKPRDPIRVFLVVQNRLMREALARLFQKQSDLVVVGQSAPGEAKASQVLHAECHVVVLESLGAISEPGFMDNLAKARCAVKSILFGMDDNEECFLKAVREGISGYLLKEASSTEIVSAVRSVARGEAVCSGRLCMSVFNELYREFRQRCGLADEEAGVKAGLTFRQRQLISLIAKGMSNKEIASSLNLSEYTVKNHVYRIMKHVEAESRQDAVDLVRSRGYLAKPS
jgi:DNA-binding NarL/FixJ family response regulator